MKEFLDNIEHGWLIVSFLYMLFCIGVAYIVTKIWDKHK